MSELLIGRITVEGTDEEIEKLKAFVTKADALLGTRYDPFRLATRLRENMPIAFEENDGTVIRSRGHWSSRKRLMRVSKDLFGETPTQETAIRLLRDKTIGHEFVHVLGSDWLGKWHRRQLLPLITPDADSWDDYTIGDKWGGYKAAPTEALACYGSAALFGWAKPAYSTLYSRRILQANYPKTKELLLATAP